MATRKATTSKTTATKTTVPKPAAKTATKSAPALAKSVATATRSKAQPTREQIAQRAYEIWLAKGQPAGMDNQNWQEAERELASHSA